MPGTWLEPGAKQKGGGSPISDSGSRNGQAGPRAQASARPSPVVLVPDGPGRRRAGGQTVGRPNAPVQMQLSPRVG